MSAVVVMLSAGEAQRLTQRIKLTASGVRDGLYKLRNLVEEAKASNVWSVLGFASWTAYLADTLADEPMRLGRDERQELVGYLAGEGLSTRAIAPIVGASQRTVANDVSNSAHLTPDPTPAEPEVVIHVAADTGEVIEPTVTEHTVTEKTKTVTGLDGKTYTRPAPKPKPTVLEGDALLDYDSKQVARRISDALHSLDGLHVAAHRNRVLTKWWPRAVQNEEVPPWGLDLFKPEPIRQIAQALNSLANELEGMK